MTLSQDRGGWFFVQFFYNILAIDLFYYVSLVSLDRVDLYASVAKFIARNEFLRGRQAQLCAVVLHTFWGLMNFDDSRRKLMSLMTSWCSRTSVKIGIAPLASQLTVGSQLQSYNKPDSLLQNQTTEEPVWFWILQCDCGWNLCGFGS